MQNNLTTLRLSAQQLVNPSFHTPAELVGWMGAMQAQDYDMVKWAIGIRLQDHTLQSVEEAVTRGTILRTHILRPTWHFVIAEDIRWMLQLTAPRIRSVCLSFYKELGITEEFHLHCRHLLEKILQGNKHLTKLEIGQELEKAGIPTDNHRISAFLFRAETDAVICSGATRNRKATYALLDERVPATRTWSREEALAKLALAYFRSHSPATLTDFVWWSGLSLTEARQAVHLICDQLHTEKSGEKEFLIHSMWTSLPATKPQVHLLPSYDEYLISYKDRSDVLHPTHFHHAFNRWGIFYPVILNQGKVVGKWQKSIRKNALTLTHSVFDPETGCNEKQLEKAADHYKRFMRHV